MTKVPTLTCIYQSRADYYNDYYIKKNKKKHEISSGQPYLGAVMLIRYLIY